MNTTLNNDFTDSFGEGSALSAEVIAQAALSGATIKQICGITDETMEGIYAYAHGFYQNGQLDEAETFFRFLCLYDFHNGEYALGMGAVFQMRKQFERAVDMYGLAFALLRLDYRPMFHTGQCQLALGKPQIAVQCFDVVVASSEDASLVHRATLYRDALNASAPQE